MNFGQNLYQWFLSNAQSLVLMAIVVIGIYLGFKREFSKLIGFLVVALIAVGLVFNAGGVKDVLLELLVGAWFTFPIDEEDVKEKIGLNEQYEEYAIHDTDNFPIAIGEYVSIEELNEMYEMIEELPDYIVECLDEFISHYGTLEEVVEHKDDIYYYPDCETMTDVAYYYIDELQALGDIPPSLQNYIDYEAYGRDLDMGGCFIETSRGMCEIPY